MKVAFYTLGCKTNQFETQALQRLFLASGHEIVAFSAPADAYVVNTCTVTALSDKKSRNACRRCKRLNPAAVLIVCGCYSQTSPDGAAEACGADFVLGTTGKGRIVRLAEEAVAAKRSIDPAGQAPAVLVDGLWGKSASRPDFELLPAGGIQGRTRALLKVQDGCQSFCAYCLIPYARGPSRSIPLEAAARQAAELMAEGYAELVITGIEISSWGLDLPQQPPLLALIQAVCRAAPGVRVRLGSLEPRTVTPEFAAGIAALANLCPHFHLSLQSGCDRTLKAMNRHYTAVQYLEACRLLRHHFPRCGITTDLIVGFPQESEADFAQSLEFIEQCQLSGVHVFPYSARKGTAAAAMPGQLSLAQREQRAHEAARVVDRLVQADLARRVGQTLSVLFERRERGLWIGHAEEYVLVEARSGLPLGNAVRPVVIHGVDTARAVLLGTLAEESGDATV